MTETVFTTLERMDCECGGVYAISATLVAQAKALGGFKKTWKCPYCDTTRGYGSGTVDNLKEQIATLERRNQIIRESRDWHEKEAEHFRKSRDGMKGALTKVKNRISKGVCPCCNRTFADLQRHMTTKHPKYASEI